MLQLKSPEGMLMRIELVVSPLDWRKWALGFLALCLFAPAAVSQDTTAKAAKGYVTKVLDLVFRIEDVGGKVENIESKVASVGGQVDGVGGQVAGVGGKVAGVGGKVADIAVKETALEIRIDLAADVLFDFDKSTLLPKARQTLHKAAGIIGAKAKGVVRIEGYTDAKGSDSYNQKLSERRANSVKDWFINKEGLRRVQFTTQGFGPKNPVAPNKKPNGSDDPVGRQKNRRVEIIITK